MKDEVPVWKRAGCYKACWFAKGKKCKCKCGGQNHAHGVKDYGNLDDEKDQRSLLSVTRKEENSSYQSELIYEALKPKVRKHEPV